MDCGRKWLVDFNAGKTQLVSFVLSNNSGVVIVKMDESVSEKKNLLRCWGWISLLNRNGALKFSLLFKLPPRKFELWFVLWSLFLLRLLQIFINLPYHLTAAVELLTHRQNIANLSLLYSHNFGRSSSELAQLVRLPYSRGRSTRYSDIFYNFSVTIPTCHKNVYVNSFFPSTARSWSSLPIERFP